MYFLISDEHKFLLGWSAKCGCSSLKRWYLDVHNITLDLSKGPVHKQIGYGNTDFTNLSKKNVKKYEDYKKYVVVRNPYSRVLSGFLSKYVINERFKNHGWKNFNAFLNVLKDDNEFKLIDRHHFTPQFSENYHKFKEFNFEFDRILTLENIDNDIKIICDDLGLVFNEMKKKNSLSYTENAQEQNWATVDISSLKNLALPSFPSFYTTNEIELVKFIYEKDFNILKNLGIEYSL